MKKLLYVLAALVLLVIIGVGVFIATFDVNQYNDKIVALVEEKTGRDFEITGELGIKVFPNPAVVVKGMRFGNADWGKAKDMVTVRRFEARVALLPLIRGAIQINRFVLIRPRVFLETNEAGVGNWVLKPTAGAQPAAEAEKPAGALPALAVRQIIVKEALISYRKAGESKPQEFALDELTASTRSIDTPLQITLRAAFNDLPVTVSGQVAPLETVAANKPYDFDLNLSAAGVNGTLRGGIARPQTLEGIKVDVDLSAASLEGLEKLAGKDLPDVKPLALSASLSDIEGGYAVSGLQLSLGQTRMSGSGSLELAGKVPAVTASLKAPLIDLTEILPPPEKDAPKQERLFSKEPLALDALKNVNAKLDLQAAVIKTHQQDISDLKTTIAIKGGKLSVDPLQATVAGGKLNGSVTLDGSGKRARLDQQIRIAGLMPGQLRALAEKKRFDGGRLDLNLNVHGQGASMSDIMGSADGKLLAKMGPGQISNKDSGTGAGAGSGLLKTLQMLNPLSKQDSSTKIECAVVNFKIADGIAKNDSGIALQTDKLNILGGGAVNLKTEELDIGVKPKAREGIGINVAGLASLVRIRGTLTDPKAGADAKEAALAGARIGAAVATGGLSLLAEGVAGSASPDEDVCAVALGKKAATQASAKESTTAGTEKKGTVEDAADKVKGVFKGLFGD